MLITRSSIADHLRSYLTQARQELSTRLLDRLYPIDDEYVLYLVTNLQRTASNPMLTIMPRSGGSRRRCRASGGCASPSERGKSLCLYFWRLDQR
jgi:hypothetical protein